MQTSFRLGAPGWIRTTTLPGSTPVPLLLGYQRMVGEAGLEPATSPLGQSALTTELLPHGCVRSQVCLQGGRVV